MSRKPLHLVALWGAGGFALLLVQAIYRLTPLALEPVLAGMAGWQWALYAASIAFNTYVEGYRAFHLQANPRVVTRAFYLAENPRPLHVALAPLFCMSLLHATKKRLVISYCVYLGIICLIILVRGLPQPWRGMVDAGVVVALSLGLISLLYHFGRALAGRPFLLPAEVPGEEPV